MSPVCFIALSALSVATTNAAALTVEGKVLDDHSGSALASASVRVFQADGRRVVADLETDRSGAFRVSGLSPGDYRFEVSKPNYVGTTLRVSLTENLTPPTLLVHFVKCGVISGLVNDQQGRPADGAHVFAINKGSGEGLILPFTDFSKGTVATVNEQGEYRLFNLPPGEYAVAVTFGASTMAMGSTGRSTTKTDFGSGVLFFPDSSRPEFFTVTGGEEFHGVDFTIAPAALYGVSGEVRPATSNGSFWLALIPPDQPSLALAVTQAEADGKFHFFGVPPGSYHLVASGPSAARGSRGGILSAEPLFGRSLLSIGGESVDGISVTVQQGVSVSFLVRPLRAGQEAKTCSGTVHLRLTPLEDWGADLERDAEVSVGGVHQLHNLAPARYYIHVTAPDNACYQAASQILDLTGNADPGLVVVPFVPAGLISGHLTNVPAHAADFVVALLESDAPKGSSPLQVALPDAKFRFAFPSLRPGRYFMLATEASSSRWIQNPAGMFAIDVIGGTTTDVELPVAVTPKGP